MGLMRRILSQRPARASKRSSPPTQLSGKVTSVFRKNLLKTSFGPQTALYKISNSEKRSHMADRMSGSPSNVCLELGYWLVVGDLG